MSSRKSRERWLPPQDEVYAVDDADPGIFFGKKERSGKRNWKALQLCKQVERAAATALAGEVLVAAVVAGVEPAPDASRLRIVVVVNANVGPDVLEEARAALVDRVPVVRAEVARSIHRKRVPEVFFDLRLEGEVRRG